MSNELIVLFCLLPFVLSGSFLLLVLSFSILRDVWPDCPLWTRKTHDHTIGDDK